MEESWTTKHADGLRLLAFSAAFFFGILSFIVYRVVAMQDQHTHYHANFALYVDGVRDEFKSPTYYEEVQTCGADTNNPRARVHLHDQDPATVHVHEKGVTWGHLFANVGYTLGDTVLKTSKGVYVDGTDGKSLTFYLNGETVVDVANRVVGDKDVLLIDYGTTDRSTLKDHYDAIPRTAAKHNSTSDPATCSGSKPLTFTERVKRAFNAN